MLRLPELSLYIHIPWCVQKCPYCDFNSHALKGELPHNEYVSHLLNDLENDLALVSNRAISTIFIGGGTPSLLSAEAMKALLDGVRTRISVLDDAEITMEANPGTVEADRFAAYQVAGINRISIGVQTFNDQALRKLGRIHNAFDARAAIQVASKLNLKSINLDLMHGLPGQTLSEALDDLQQAIALAPPHLSWYQLTLEPHTLFGSRPPQLPDDDLLWQIYHQGHELLISAGYQQYETSAYAREGFQCRHNLNYWRFGDYLGIGCGAHGKLSFNDGRILRTTKTRHPAGYLQGNYLAQRSDVNMADRPFEFFMNRFRLLEAVPKADFFTLTGCDTSVIKQPIEQAIENGYLIETEEYWQITEKGKLFLNSLLELFL